MTTMMIIISIGVCLLSSSATGARLPVTAESTAAGSINCLIIVTVKVTTRKAEHGKLV